MLFHDQKSISISPSKGKAKEDDHWNVGWWEFHSLVEQPRRPIEWSDVSVIFTAHPTQPLITGRHFSSSKSFIIAPPTPKSVATPVYAPPTVITCSPGSEWLFAYFPGHIGDGLACIWKRGPQIDVWNQQHAWNVSRNAGAVTARWLGGRREWSFDANTNLPTRLPPRGPQLAVANPTLALVTQDRRIHIWYLRTLQSNFKCLNFPLYQFGHLAENFQQPPPPNDPTVGPGGVQLCTHAAICLSYNEHSLLVAMRSCSYPVPDDDLASVDLNMSMGLPPSNPVEQQNWASLGEEAVVEITDVQVMFNGLFMTLAVNPLTPLYHPNPGLTQLTFICTPPAPRWDSAKSPATNRKDGSKGSIYLAISCLDFSGYSNTPRSSLTLYRFARVNNQWKPHLAASRTFESSVLGFTLPQVTQLGSGEPGFFAGLLATYGSTVRRKTHATAEASIGSIHVFKLSDLQDHPGWESSSLICPLDRLGRELPLNASVSPNQMLVVTVTSGLASTATAVHSLPNKTSTQMIIDDDATSKRDLLSQKIVSAILSGYSPEDTTQYLALPTTSLSVVVEVLNMVHTTLEGALQYPADGEFLGLLVEIYRLRSQSTTDEHREACREKYETAHDIVSLAACNKGFDFCSEGDLYDLSAVWQLISMSTWMVNFVEQLMKESVLSYALIVPDTVDEGIMGLDDDSTLPDSPMFLPLAHPFALTNLRDSVHHVNCFHKHLSSISAKRQNALIAKTVLDDLINGCGVDLAAFELLLNEVIQDVDSLPVNEVRRSLDACQPSQALTGHIRKVLKRINTSAVLNKPRLFLKPSDLVDGIARLSFEPHKSHEAMDVVSKGSIPERTIQLSCVRCRGKAAPFSTDAQSASGRPPRWWLWQKSWEKHCICWGSWSLG